MFGRTRRPHPSYFGSRRTPRRRRSFLSPRLIIALFVALTGLVTYYGTKSTNEVTGEVQRVRLTPEQEVALGLEAAPDMAAQHGGLYEDEGIQRYVEEVGQRIVERSGAAKGGYEFDFHVLADPQTVNAFALPGGQVFITVALLSKLRDESELAAVLGHEVAHVVARHGAEHLAKAGLTQALVGAAAIGSWDSENPYRSVRTAAMAQAVGSLLNLRYGRNDELESDALGVRFAAEAGYDARGMLGLMNVLSNAGGRGGQPEFFSTHPNPENRIAQLQQHIQRYGADGGEKNEERFAREVLSRLGGTQRDDFGVGGSGTGTGGW